jgi:hypothetical protein
VIARFDSLPSSPYKKFETHYVNVGSWVEPETNGVSGITIGNPKTTPGILPGQPPVFAAGKAAGATLQTGCPFSDYLPVLIAINACWTNCETRTCGTGLSAVLIINFYMWTVLV